MTIEQAQEIVFYEIDQILLKHGGGNWSQCKNFKQLKEAKKLIIKTLNDA